MKKNIQRILLLLFCSVSNGFANHSDTFLDASSEIAQPLRELYIDLMKKILCNAIYEDVNCTGVFNAMERDVGCDYPTIAHTMMGMKRLNNIHWCMEQVLKDKIPGDCIETGVWRGGGTILMRAILKIYGDTTRRIWVADSFEGLPPPNPDKYPEDLGLDLYKFTFLSVPLKTVQQNFKQYDLLDEQVVFLQGFFRDTLPSAPIEKLALLRLDGDLYESTMDALVNLYPKLSIGGYVIIDDYGAIGACAKAVQDYRQSSNISDEMHWIDFTGVYWKKTH